MITHSENYTDQHRDALIRSLKRARGWNLLKRHAHALPRTGEPWKASLANIFKRLGSGFTIALIGDRGRGKTQLAHDLMLQSVADLGSAEYSTVTGLLLEIKSTFNYKSDKTELEVFKELASPKLLVLDEFEKRGDTDWENRVLFELINQRYSTMLDTLLLSNLSKPQFETMIGPSLASRMNETGGILVCNWPSFR